MSDRDDDPVREPGDDEALVPPADGTDATDVDASDVDGPAAGATADPALDSMPADGGEPASDSEAIEAELVASEPPTSAGDEVIDAEPAPAPAPETPAARSGQGSLPLESARRRAAPAPGARSPEAAVPEEGVESFGRWLRRQRVVREIDLREIADSSKISLRYLQALEDERFDLLPAPVFAQGFLRQYARYVGIDPEETVNFFQSARRQQLEAKEDSLAPLMSEPRRRTGAANLTYGLLVLLVIAALVALVWWLQGQAGRQQENGATAGVATAAPAVADSGELPAPTAGDATLTGPLRATLDFNGECWVEAWSDGERQITERHVQGESLSLDADNELILNLGDVTVVELEVNGHPFAPGSGKAQRWLRFTREQVVELERGEPIAALEVEVGEGSPRRPPPPPPSGGDAEETTAGATGAGP